MSEVPKSKAWDSSRWKATSVVLLILLVISLGYVTYTNYVSPSTARIKVSGNWSLSTAFVANYNVTGANVYVLNDSETDTGGISGHYVGQEVDTILPSGAGTFYGGGWFSGTIAGKSGTAYESFVGSFNSTGYSVGKWAMNHGTGGFAGLAFQGTFEGQCQNASCSQSSGIDAGIAQFNSVGSS